MLFSCSSFPNIYASGLILTVMYTVSFVLVRIRSVSLHFKSIFFQPTLHVKIQWAFVCIVWDENSCVVQTGKEGKITISQEEKIHIHQMMKWKRWTMLLSFLCENRINYKWKPRKNSMLLLLDKFIHEHKPGRWTITLLRGRPRPLLTHTSSYFPYEALLSLLPPLFLCLSFPPSALHLDIFVDENQRPVVFLNSSHCVHPFIHPFNLYLTLRCMSD